jgi:NitT/TauT family transport system substrate-binding protein
MSAPVTSISRRGLMVGGAGALLAAPFIGKGVARAEGEAKPFRIAWNTGAVCSAPVGYAIEKGIFAKHGIAAETLTFAGSTEQLLEALATGKAEGAVGMALRWFKPLEQGFDVKLIAGTHGGCLRLLGWKPAGIERLEDLKGKVVAVADQSSPAKSFISLRLALIGIDPAREVDWRVYPGNLLGLAVEKGEAQALAHWDPDTHFYLKDERYVQIATNLDGEFANRTCCVFAVPGKLYREDKATVRAAATALLEAAAASAKDPRGTAEVFFNAYKPKSGIDDLTAMVSYHTHNHNPVGEALKQEIVLYADELKKVQVLKSSTDSRKFAERVYGDVFS